MFDTIILLTGPVEQPVLGSVLRRHNPRLTVLPVSTLEELAAVETLVLRRARLIAFAIDVIVPQNVLGQLGYGAYNFHPGTPQYPGWAPAYFALHDHATEFGATLHIMVKRVDTGPIVDVARFAVPAGIGVVGLEELAYAQLAQMFWRSAKLLATCAESLPECSVRWGEKKNFRRDYEATCGMLGHSPKDEPKHRIKLAAAAHSGISPAIDLRAVQFSAALPDPAEA